MKPSSLIATLIAALACTATLRAAEPPEKPGPPPPPHGPLFKALDTDANGTLSSAEISGSSAALRKLDSNGDGELSRDEYKIDPPPRPPEEGNPGAKPPHGPPSHETDHKPPHGKPPLLAALDKNGDGTISKSEIEAAAQSLKSLDKNGDGELTDDELRPPPPTGDKPAGGGPQGPPPPNAGKRPGGA